MWAALILAVGIALVAAMPGPTGNPGPSSSDQAAHDAAVAAAVVATVGSGAAGSGAADDALVDTPPPAVDPSPTPSPSPVPSPSDPMPVPTPAAATPAPTPTPTPTPTITPPPRPALVDRAVPSSVLASLGSVFADKPQPYYDGCHVSMGGRMPNKPCLYGHLSSHTTIAIYGDSHALAWFPAVLRMVNDRGWRLLEVTMSACIPADVIPYYPTTHSVMTACVNFRKAALAKLAHYHPTVILVTGTRGFETISSSGRVLTGAARTTAWVNGMKRTLNKLIPLTSRVVMLADTPVSRYRSPTTCIRAHPSSERACATPVIHAVNYTWLNTEYHVALAKHVAFIDAERWVCPTSPCPLVRGNFVVYRNAGHLTARYSGTMWKKMESAVLTILTEPRAVIGP